MDAPCLALPVIWGAPLRSSRGSEELQRDVVGIAERKARAVMRVHDPAVLDSQLAESGFPLFEFAAVRASECEVVQSNASLVETFGAAVRELMKGDQGLARRPYDVAKRASVLVEDGLRTEECSIPRNTSI